MKNILTFAIVLSGVSVLAQAQEQLPTTPFRHSEVFLESLEGARSMGQDIYVEDNPTQAAPMAAPAALQAEEMTIGYLNPAGTLFLGIDEDGKGTFMRNPGVIGGWSDSIPCWKWINKQTSYRSIKYLTAFSYAYPSYCDGENYAVDAWGNFCDTIVASGGYQDALAMDADGDQGNYWQHATPLQTTRLQDNTETNFMLLSSAASPEAKNCPLAAGGLPSGNSKDGLWPLTNAVSTTRAGVSMELLDKTRSDGKTHYLFGASLMVVDSTVYKFDENRLHALEGMIIALDNIDEILTIIKDSQSKEEAQTAIESKYGVDNEQSKAILEMNLAQLTDAQKNSIRNEYNDIKTNGTRDSVAYTYAFPTAIITHYDKPQTPLYIKSVSVAMSSSEYNASDMGNFNLDTLYLTIRTEDGTELASSKATKANLSPITYQPGVLLTFPFSDTTAYGELVKEGLLVKEAFRIEITGFKESDNFGIFAAKCYVHPTKTEMLYEGGATADVNYEPYIMLNGIYPTLEDFYVVRGAETGQEGDTIPVNMIPYAEGGYRYTAAYAKWGTHNDEFAFYSTFKPYDATTRTWTMDIDVPSYIRINADYEYNLGDDEDPVTLWEYYRAFTMHIYATETPVIGDVIKIGKCGKYIYFRIDAINGETAVENVTVNGKAEKFVSGGQILIRKNGELYNVIGQKIQH